MQILGFAKYSLLVPVLVTWSLIRHGQPHVHILDLGWERLEELIENPPPWKVIVCFMKKQNQQRTKIKPMFWKKYGSNSNLRLCVFVGIRVVNCCQRLKLKPFFHNHVIFIFCCYLLHHHHFLLDFIVALMFAQWYYFCCLHNSPH